MNKFSSRPIIKEVDYEIMKEWWDIRNFAGTPYEFTPSNGIMVLNGDQPVVGGFIVETNSNVAMLTSISSDPSLSKEDRGLALDVLIEDAINVCRMLGYGMISCACTIPTLMSRFEKHGLIKTDEGVSHFGGLLCR